MATNVARRKWKEGVMNIINDLKLPICHFFPVYFFFSYFLADSTQKAPCCLIENSSFGFRSGFW